MRLDAYLLQNKYFESRTKASQSIERGEVFVNGKQIQKVSFEMKDDVDYEICIKRAKSFVSLGGYKLDKALSDFNYGVSGLVCADFGASTGGFTDCLLQRGVSKVFAIDLNDTLLHQSLKNDQRVVQITKNIKNLTKSDFNTNLDLIVADLSFISVSYAIPIISNLIDNEKDAIILIKPQFEMDKRTKFKNGIIKDKKAQVLAVKKAYNCAIENGLTPINFTTAPINKDKNIEFLMHLKKGGENAINIENIKY